MCPTHLHHGLILYQCQPKLALLSRFWPHSNGLYHHTKQGFDGPTTIGVRYTNLGCCSSIGCKCLPSFLAQISLHRCPRLGGLCLPNSSLFHRLQRLFPSPQTIGWSTSAQSQNLCDHHAGFSIGADRFLPSKLGLPNRPRWLCAPQSDPNLHMQQARQSHLVLGLGNCTLLLLPILWQSNPKR